jgi:hypothetical protein
MLSALDFRHGYHQLLVGIHLLHLSALEGSWERSALFFYHMWLSLGSSVSTRNKQSFFQLIEPFIFHHIPIFVGKILDKL